MIETGAMMGAEESGGFGFGMHLPERDGIYADLLLLDLFLREKAAGRWPVSQAIAALPRDRRAVVLPPHRRPRRARRRTPRRSAGCWSTSPAAPPTELAGEPVARTDALDTNDGFKFFLADGSWLLVRASRHRAARPRLHRGHLAPSCATRCSSPGERLVRGA